jgi:hypothetical protein
MQTSQTVEMAQSAIDFLAEYGRPLGMTAEEVLKAVVKTFISRGVYPPKVIPPKVETDSEKPKAS